MVVIAVEYISHVCIEHSCNINLLRKFFRAECQKSDVTGRRESSQTFQKSTVVQTLCGNVSSSSTCDHHHLSPVSPPSTMMLLFIPS